ncbi:hypothetical protein A4A49_13864 [Nicotiana attenuata]|uniref:Uncharacterized protein n=1 Tax=Nicotiana attenuata TaxID=49451 RepID=A0A314L308_NICAT|nr:hypothetical protein A4A49_13864 [Nicotiana attenuata]
MGRRRSTDGWLVAGFRSRGWLCCFQRSVVVRLGDESCWVFFGQGEMRSDGLGWKMSRWERGFPSLLCVVAFSGEFPLVGDRRS